MRVKGLIALLTSILVSSVLPQVAHATDLPSFEIKSVSSTMIDPGDTVTWKIQVNLVPGWVKDLNVALRTPAGEIRNISVLVEPTYKVSEAGSKEISLSLKTNDFDLPGKYKLLYGSIYNEKEFFAYDPTNAKEYAGKGYMVAQNLSQFDFTIRDSGTGVQKTPQLIESISFVKPQIDPGASAKLSITTKGSGQLTNVYVQIASPDGVSNFYCDTYSPRTSTTCLDLSIENGKYSFSVPVWTAEDSSPGLYKVTQINLSYRNGAVTSSNNDTASWGGNIVYEDSESTYNGVKAQKLSQFATSNLGFKLLDAGQGIAQAPIWTNLAWKKTTIQAGSTATLTITLNGFSRNIGSVGIRTLSTTSLNGDDVMVYTNQNGQEQVVRKVNQTNESDSKTGTFEVDVYIPRNAKPGSYGIGELILWSTSCKIPAINSMNIISSVNNLNCQSWPNGWYTQFSMGNLFTNLSSSGNKAKAWTGYVNPLSAKLEVTAAAPLEAPKLEEVEVGPLAIEYRYLYSNEQSCIGSTSAGDLVDDKIQRDAYRIFKVNNLKPDSSLTVKLTCTDSQGAKAESSIDSRTSKPIPPASPKLTLDSVTTNSAVFSIGIREGFKYSVKTETGESQITGSKETGYKIEVSGLKPGIKTYLIATISDAFGQSTSTEPIYFSAELPPKPAKPVITVGKVTTTRVEFKYEKLPDLDYELSVSEGSVSDIKGSVSVSGLSPNTKIIASVKVIDQFGQSATSDEYLLKSAIPDLPAIPALFLTKATSDSITLRFTPRSGMSFFVKASRGIAKISDGSIYITGLSANEKVEVILIMNDGYGQQKISEPYKYTTAQAPKVATKTTITCVKGKASKVITAINPTCPTGYTKK